MADLIVVILEVNQSQPGGMGGSFIDYLFIYQRYLSHLSPGGSLRKRANIQVDVDEQTEAE